MLCRLTSKPACPKLSVCGQNKLFEHQWSPEQIACRMKRERSPYTVSCATTYRALRQGLLNRGKQEAKRHLRHKGKRRRKSSDVETKDKILISNQLIKRPISAENRFRYGHWETDTVAGKKVGLHC